MRARTAEEMLHQVRALPGMDAVLPALDGLAPTYLVGGAVRDLLRGELSHDLDLAVEGDATEVAGELASRLGGGAVTAHDRFGTATVRAGGGELDLASARRETYSAPGVLPEVEPADMEEDLARRDFTVNAMAVPLSGARAGELLDPFGGAADLAEGLLRVLHDRSFADDPTRLVRAARYAARLGLRLEAGTEAQARDAVAAGVPATLSGPRLREALLELLAEDEAPTALETLRDLGVPAALNPPLAVDPELVAAAALGSAETGANRVLAALAALAEGAEAPGAFVERLGLPAGERDAVARAAERGEALAERLRASLRDSQLHDLLLEEPPEALALALAHGAPAEPVLRFTAELRPAALEIDGTDLLAAGVPEGPAVGRALAQTLRRKLDGELSGREEELRAALEEARAR